MVRSAGKNGGTRRSGGGRRAGRGRAAEAAAVETNLSVDEKRKALEEMPAEASAAKAPGAGSDSGIAEAAAASSGEAQAETRQSAPEVVSDVVSDAAADAAPDVVSDFASEGNAVNAEPDAASKVASCEDAAEEAALPEGAELTPHEAALPDAEQATAGALEQPSAACPPETETACRPEPSAGERVPGELDMLRGALFSEDLEQAAVEQMFQWKKERPQSGADGGEEAELSGAALLEVVHHGRHVAALALALFESLAPRFGLDMRWARMLAQAALWHDLGFAVGGRRRHHKRSMEIIEENVFLSLSFGLTEEERPLVALLARYHRRAWPSMRHRRFAALCREDRKALRAAAAVLRIADALDYRHKGAVEEVRVSLRRHAVRLVCFGSEPCGRECRRALKKGDLFEDLYGGRLEVVQGKEGDRDAG